MMNEMTDPTNPTPAIDDENQKKNEQLLEKMLEDHEKWLDCTGYGKRFCINNLGPPFWKLNPHFRNRDLRHAIFDGCNVRDVDFSGSNLAHASFIDTRARGAIFHDANCTAANFRKCDLTSAKFNGNTILTWANFHLASGPFVLGYFGMHHAIAYADAAVIGCSTHPIDVWLEDGEMIGEINEYEKHEIDVYIGWLKLAKKTLKEMNK